MFCRAEVDRGQIGVGGDDANVERIYPENLSDDVSQNRIRALPDIDRATHHADATLTGTATLHLPDEGGAATVDVVNDPSQGEVETVTGLAVPLWVTGGSLSDVKPGRTIVASTDSLAADAFGWEELLERKGEPLPAYFGKSAARKVGDPDWRGHLVKEVQVG